MRDDTALILDTSTLDDSWTGASPGVKSEESGICRLCYNPTANLREESEDCYGHPSFARKPIACEELHASREHGLDTDTAISHLLGPLMTDEKLKKTLDPKPPPDKPLVN